MFTDKPTLAGVPLIPVGDGRYRLPTMAGGDPNSPTTYPIDPASISGTTITVDQYVENPQVITRTIADLTMQRFFADRIFSPGPDVTGGAILFERPNALQTDLYADRDVEEVAPGSEFPILTFTRGEAMRALPRKIGGAWDVTKEARKRNNVRLVDRAMVQTANTIRRKTELMALSELAAVITAESRTTAAVSGGWGVAAGTTLLNISPENRPMADIAHAQTTVDLEERGHVLNGMILNPADLENLRLIYDDSLNRALADQGITEYFATPRLASGAITLYEAGQVGFWSNEFPLEETTWIEEKTDNTFWYQWSISPTMGVDDQFALMQVTGV